MGGRSRALVVTTPETPVVLDKLRRGSVDIWPIQSAEPAHLADEIADGKHDDHLSDLEHAERVRRSAPEVLDAIRRRRGPG